jgi:hypothetical protein
MSQEGKKTNNSHKRKKSNYVVTSQVSSKEKKFIRNK